MLEPDLQKSSTAQGRFGRLMQRVSLSISELCEEVVRLSVAIPDEMSSVVADSKVIKHIARFYCELIQYFDRGTLQDLGYKRNGYSPRKKKRDNRCSTIIVLLKVSNFEGASKKLYLAKQSTLQPFSPPLIVHMLKSHPQYNCSLLSFTLVVNNWAIYSFHFISITQSPWTVEHTHL